MSFHNLLVITCGGLSAWYLIDTLVSEERQRNLAGQEPAISLSYQTNDFMASCAGMGGLTIPTRIADDEILLLCLEATVFLDSQRIVGDQ
jgi:hypothetical protein